MLTAKEDSTLTGVGSGTPMGDLLRRYWYPIAAAEQLEGNPVKAVTLLGESLVLHRATRRRC
jgi:5,5'-dehydrodivanillate O-demethylase